MNNLEALQIVYEMALANQLDEHDIYNTNCEPELVDIYQKQDQALEIIAKQIEQLQGDL